MGCTELQARTRLESVKDFRVEGTLARRDKTAHQLQAGDSGEVLRKLALGNNHSVIIRWDKIAPSQLGVDGALSIWAKSVG